MGRLLLCSTSLWIIDEETPDTNELASLIFLGLTEGGEGILNLKSGTIEELIVLVVISNKETYSLSDEETSLRESTLTERSASLTLSVANKTLPVVDSF